MTSSGGQVDPGALQIMPAPLREALFHGISSGLSTVFLWAIPFSVAVALLAIFIKEIPLRDHDDMAQDGEARPERSLAPAME